MTRDELPRAVSRLIDNRPVRWARTVGDYDGRERTLQVFCADPGDQRALLERVDADRARLEATAGGPLILIFHSVRQSRERYADFVDGWRS